MYVSLNCECGGGALTGQNHTYAHFFGFLLGGFGGDIGCFEREGGEVVCCRHGCGFAVVCVWYQLGLSVARMLEAVESDFVAGWVCRDDRLSQMADER
jgi:hypothetical protein